MGRLICICCSLQRGREGKHRIPGCRPPGGPQLETPRPRERGARDPARRQVPQPGTRSHPGLPSQALGLSVPASPARLCPLESASLLLLQPDLTL